MTTDARFKPVPPAPDDLDQLHEARRGIPLVPSVEGDCCARIASRLDLEDRDAGQTWFTFLRALKLLERGERGYRRTREDLDPAELGVRFRNRVVGADAIVSAVEAADDPIPLESVFDRIRETVPEWERRRHEDWESVWRDRTERLTGWAVLFGLVTVDEQSRLSTTS